MNGLNVEKSISSGFRIFNSMLRYSPLSFLTYFLDYRWSVDHEKELLHLCNFCDSSPTCLKTHSKRHQNVLPMALYVTCEESFERGYNKKKRPSAQKLMI